MSSKRVLQQMIGLAIVMLVISCSRNQPTEPEDYCEVEWQTMYGIDIFNKGHQLYPLQ